MTISKTTVKGQVIIPAELRKKFNIRKGTRIAISEGEGGVILLKPIPEDVIEASKGMLRGRTSIIASLLEDRKKEARRG
jgi:AbrB family looped-hinge helix DNA binding protein